MNQWQYCVVGNIIKYRIDEEGILRFGTSGFRGGTKVYLYGKLWNFNSRSIEALGLSRGRRFQVLDVPREAIINVRCQRTYKPRVLEIMDDFEFKDGWWKNTEEDKLDAERFVEEWYRTFYPN